MQLGHAQILASSSSFISPSPSHRPIQITLVSFALPPARRDPSSRVPYRSTSASEKKSMVVRLRLQRFGRTHSPFYRMVAADSRAPRDGKFLEIVS